MAFRLNFFEAVSNDNFTDAVDLGLQPIVQVNAERGPSTAEPGDPTGPFQRWWKWTAPAAGRVKLSGVSAYQGTTYEDLTVILKDPSVFDNAIIVAAGQELYLATESTTLRDNDANFELDFLQISNSNDHFGDAITLSQETSHHLGADLRLMTVEADEPSSDPNARPRSAWWAWVAPFEGVFYFRNLRSSPLLSVYTGDGFQNLAEATPIIPGSFYSGFEMTAGTEYRIRMEERSNANQWSEVSLEAFRKEDAPDALADAIDLGQTIFREVEVSLRGATLEEGEPQFFGERGFTQEKSLWFTWTAPASGELKIRTETFTGNASLGIFRDSPFGEDVEGHLKPWTGNTKVPVVAGEKLWIGIFELRELQAPGMITLSVSIDLVSPYVTFDGAVDLGSDWNIDSVTPWFHEDDLDSILDIWFKWTAPDDGNLNLRVEADVYQGSAVDNLIFLGERKNFRVEESETYYFRTINNWRDPHRFGNLYFEATGAAAPENDDFHNATLLENSHLEEPFDLTGAGGEDGESFFYQRSIWYRWIAPETGFLTVSTKILGGGTNDLINVQLYQGETLGDLTELGLIDEGNSSESFGVDGGQEILIRVSFPGNQAGQDEGDLFLDFKPTFANDSRLFPKDLGAAAQLVFSADNTGSTRGALESGNSSAIHPGTVWYEWTSPLSGYLFMETSAGYLELYPAEGEAGDRLLLKVHTSTTAANSYYPVEAGVPYLLRYSSEMSQGEGSSEIALRLEPFSLSESQREFAEPLPRGGDFQISGTFVGASLDQSVSYEELSFTPDASLWYEWIAPQSGTYQITRFQGGSDLAIWQDEGTEDLVFMAEGDRFIQFNAKAQQRYLISTFGQPLFGSGFLWDLQRIEDVSNDDFANALGTGDADFWEVETHNLTATSEEGEPSHGLLPSTASLWFTWTASASGSYLVSAAGSESPQVVAAYLGNPLGDHARLGSGRERIIIDVTEGETYHIATDLAPGSNRGDIRLSIEAAWVPENDLFENRIILDSNRPVINRSLRFASLEAGEPVLEEWTNGSLWYQWTPPGDLPIHNPGSNLNIFSSSFPDPQLTELVRESPERSGWSYFLARENVTYFVQVTTALHGGDDFVSLDPTQYLPFAAPFENNDAFSDRILLESQTKLRAGVSAFGFYRDRGEPESIRENFSGWWEWTVPEAGVYTFTWDGRGELSIFSGSDLDALLLVGEGSNGSLEVSLGAGNVYQIARSVESLPNSRSNYNWLEFDLEIGTFPPANDDFNGALDLGSRTRFESEQENHRATAEVLEPSGGAFSPIHSVWLKWQPERGSSVTISTDKSECDLAIFTGDVLESLTQIASGTASVTFDAITSRLYYIRVDSQGGCLVN